MKPLLTNLSLRERQLIYVGAVLVLFLVPAIIWLSLHGRIARLQTVVDERQALDQWMQAAAQEAARLRGTRVQRSGPGKAGDQSLLALVDQTARRSGLHDALRRVEPDKDSSVRVWFEGVAFDDMVRWLSDLTRSDGVDVDVVNVEKQPRSGIVNARLVLTGGAQ